MRQFIAYDVPLFLSATVLAILVLIWLGSNPYTVEFWIITAFVVLVRLAHKVIKS